MVTRELFPRCPSCAALVDDATGLGNGKRQPSPGDITVCCYCAIVLVVTETHGFRRAEPAELDELEGSKRELLERAVALLKRKPFPKPSETGAPRPRWSP